jgi:hypothetical protein
MNETETPAVEAPAVVEAPVTSEVAAPVEVVAPVAPEAVEVPATNPEPSPAVDAPVTEVVKPKRHKRKAKRNLKRAVGRPRLYDGRVRRTIASALKKHGLTKGIKSLRKEKKLKVSLTTALSVAAEYNLKFTRGRPKSAA